VNGVQTCALPISIVFDSSYGSFPHVKIYIAKCLNSKNKKCNSCLWGI